jgi:peroxiredoxin
MDKNDLLSVEPNAASPSLGVPIACFILGILSIAFSFFLIGGLLALCGIILGLVHVRRGTVLRGLVIWGLCLSLLGLILSGTFGIFYYRIYKQFIEFSEGDYYGGFSADDWKTVQAPDLEVTALDGTKFRLEELKGKRVVLNFWATWCAPCVMEIPHFVKLAEETSTDDLVIIGISDEDTTVLKAFIKEKGINYAVVSDDELPSPYGLIHSIPTTFFIDRNGVIQEVFEGYHDYDDLRAAALSEDFSGEVLTSPASAVSGLKEPEIQHTLSLQWEKKISGSSVLCTGDWNRDGSDDILVANHRGRIQVLDRNGNPIGQFQLPTGYAFFEIGHHASQGPRLLAYTVWGQGVDVFDSNGKKLWSYPTNVGINGAHWGDLDGDGSDEMIVGMNGGGGLHAVSSDGKKLWSYMNIGNVWSQAIVTPEEPESCLVFATEAGGTVRVFSNDGKLLRTLSPLGEYYAEMTASVINQTGEVQVLALGNEEIVAFDPQGNVAWKTPGMETKAGWTANSFAAGDMDGDGSTEWAFFEASGDLVIASSAGTKLASLSKKSKAESFVIAGKSKDKGLLVILSRGTISAYSLLLSQDLGVDQKENPDE